MNTNKDLEIVNLKQRLSEAERQRDEAASKHRLDITEMRRQHQQEANEWKTDEEITAERDQLIKVVDELVRQVRAGLGTHGDPCHNQAMCQFMVDGRAALSAYSLLPHVQAKKGNKQ